MPVTATRRFAFTVARISQSVVLPEHVSAIADRAETIDSWLNRPGGTLAIRMDGLRLAFQGGDAAVLPLDRLLAAAGEFEQRLEAVAA